MVRLWITDATSLSQVLYLLVVFVSPPSSTSLMAASAADQSTPANLSRDMTASPPDMADISRLDILDARVVQSTSDKQRDAQELSTDAPTRISQDLDALSNKFAQKDDGRMAYANRKKESLNISKSKKTEKKYRTKLECSICFLVRTFSDANCLRRHEREIHQMHGGSRKLFCQHKNRNNHKKNPFKRPEYSVAHMRAIHGGQPSDSHDAVIQDELKPTTTVSELKSNEETP
ncbi:hypothetical protein KCU81_g10036, partial [Aureobasidium melanogenum]|uniref:C2H2-type domain-containing protein n=1 Tax=Aureobasidium melanogenum (strain CBS 110374) TaxID=1043003 RepID=A0A074VBG3_AURM1